MISPDSEKTWRNISEGILMQMNDVKTSCVKHEHKLTPKE